MMRDSLYDRGNTLSDLGRHSEALESYNESLKSSLMMLLPFNNRGITLRDLGRHSESLESRPPPPPTGVFKNPA